MRKVALTTTAARDLLGLEPAVAKAMRALIRDYAAGKAVDARPMRSRSDEVRLKDGDHRAIVTVERRTVTVLRVRHRSVVYRP